MAIVLYVIAKIAELLDREIYSLGQMISGHTLKHLFAGLVSLLDLSHVTKA